MSIKPIKQDLPLASASRAQEDKEFSLLLSLPKDVICKVIQCLSSSDVAQLGSTCHELYSLSTCEIRNLTFRPIAPSLAPLCERISRWRFTSPDKTFSLVCSIDMTKVSCDEQNLMALASKFPNIQKIKAPSTLSDEQLSSIASHFPLLKTLDLTYCQVITDRGVERLSSLKNLSSLNLSGCHQITDSNIADLSTLTNLTSLKIGTCRQITDRGLDHLSALRNLKDLSLDNCGQISGNGLAFLSSLIDLKHLSLRGYNNILDEGLAHLSSLVNLSSLNLSQNYQITDRGLEHLSSLTTLTDLNLHDCFEITDNGLAYLSSLKNLSSLNLNLCSNISSHAIYKLQLQIPLLKVSNYKGDFF